jgi:AraC family transcriptional regulator of adaptative response / DNA-3-methyladenine glycosylase II
MEIDANACYRALEARDTRFDGVFFVGVSTTGIYCRTVCTAKRPRRDRCTFYPSAAAAEREGFRPCLRCRPELAPGNARIDAVGRLAAAAASRIEDGALTEGSVEELAADMGVSDRHLRRAIRVEFGVSPIELAQTQRLLLAKRLLTDTDMPVIDVAFASGFSSLRRFNALFRERYRLNPTALRRSRPRAELPETIVCELAYRPPLDWEALVAFLGARASSGVEWVDGDRYLRTAGFGKHRGWFAVGPSRRASTLRVELAASLAPVLSHALARVKRLFDLAAEPREIAAHLGPIAAARPGLRVPGAFDGFEMAVRAILGQQVSVRAATTLAGRFAGAFGEEIETPSDHLTRLAPRAERVAALDEPELVALGIGAPRARAILALARAVAAGEVALEPGRNVDETLELLRELPGIGEWTAQYIAMRALGWPDAFPHTDLGVRKALGVSTPGRVLAAAEAWRPWRAYATMHLWHSLEAK